jgi:hypothetical protein
VSEESFRDLSEMTEDISPWTFPISWKTCLRGFVRDHGRHFRMYGRCLSGYCPKPRRIYFPWTSRYHGIDSRDCGPSFRNDGRHISGAISEVTGDMYPEIYPHSTEDLPPMISPRCQISSPKYFRKYGQCPCGIVKQE